MAKTPAQRAAKYGDQATPGSKLSNIAQSRRTPRKAQGNANMILIAGSVASLFLFWYLHLLTLTQMTDLSGGLAMPDSMVFGFNITHIEALRAAMNSDALGQLQFVHKTAGMLFPLVFGITALTLIATSVPKKKLRWGLWAFPLLFAVIQIWANISIDNMLGAKVLDAGAVTLTSALVIASWFLLAASLVSLTVVLILRRRPKRAASPAES